MTAALHELPDRLQPVMARSKKLSWAMIAYLLVDVVVLYVLVSGSQAVLALIVEDGLELVPPILFLLSAAAARKPPSSDCPYGYHRSITLAYFAASLALLAFGLAILLVAARSLLEGAGPGVGTVGLFGLEVWRGWVVIAYLVVSAAIPWTLGHLLKQPAGEINNKVLFASARMLAADWRSSAAAIVGLLGLRFGIWWLDAVAAGFIAVGVIADGYENTKRAGQGLIDHMPTAVGSDDVVDLVDRIREIARKHSWVQDAELRLREHGPVYFGVLMVDTGRDEVAIHDLRQLEAEITELDWRIQEVLVVPTTNRGELRREVEQAGPHRG